MSGARRGRSTQNTEAVVLWSAISAAVLVVGGLWVTMHVGSWLDHRPPPPNQPVTLISQLAKGQIPFPHSGFVVLAVQAGAVALLAAAAGLLYRKFRKRLTARGDRAVCPLFSASGRGVISATSCWCC